MLQVGERLGRYEVEKRCAVEKEDYDLAKEKKQQQKQPEASTVAMATRVDMEEVRTSVA